VLSGSAGLDVLIGGPGRDQVKAGLKGDKIKVRDGERDSVNCGPGNDLVIADRMDKLKGCERIKPPRKKHKKKR